MKKQCFKTVLDIFKKCWAGQAPLWQAFWLVAGLFLTIIQLFIILILELVLWCAGHPDHNFFVLAQYAGYAMLPYTIFAFICIWRCGKNSEQIWNISTKVFIIYYSITYTLNLISPSYIQNTLKVALSFLSKVS